VQPLVLVRRASRTVVPAAAEPGAELLAVVVGVLGVDVVAEVVASAVATWSELRCPEVRQSKP
jgi:hypothetical protein